MQNIAIITARSGSKGIKDKNIKLLNGKPLMAYSIEAALQAEVFSTVMVSTDSEEYARVAKKYGAEVPFLRSAENSGDNAGSWDVALEVLNCYKNNGKNFDSVCLLQPTSPLRSPKDIIEAYELFTNKSADAVTSVCECEHHIQDMMQLDDSLSLVEFRRNNPDMPRQFYPKVYRLNGAIFIRKIDDSSSRIRIVSDREVAYVMDQDRSIDIDTINDFRYAEFLMRNIAGEL